MSVNSVMLPNHLILCCPLLFLPSILPSIWVFSNESALHIGWPNYWSFHFSSSPSSEYSGLMSFRNDWFDFFAVQGTLKSLCQHHSLKASILQGSAFIYGPTFISIHNYLYYAYNPITQCINLFSGSVVGQSWIIRNYVYFLSEKGCDFFSDKILLLDPSRVNILFDGHWLRVTFTTI